MKLGVIKCDETIWRILKIDGDKVLAINCTSTAMPTWLSSDSFSMVTEISETDLPRMFNVDFDPEEISAAEKNKAKRIMRTIEPILSVIGDDIERNAAISASATLFKTSKQTIRRRLCKYLIFQTPLCFTTQTKHELTAAEKNFRYILNKYYYTATRRSLHTCYLYLLREKYSNGDGLLLQDYPKEYQFRYYYYSHRKTESCLISRYGRFKYDRDFKPLLGDSLHYFDKVGMGEVDSTVADIYLVDDVGATVGRPNITAMVCPFSRMLLGYTVGYEGGTDSLVDLMLNVNSNKVEHCREFGLEIKDSDWLSPGIPTTIITDRGTEYISENYSQLVELGISITNLRQYSPNDKGMVEQFFNIIQGYFKQYLTNDGVIREDYVIRGAPDYRKMAVLTLREFQKILLICINHYNTRRIIEHMPHEYFGEVPPFANEVFARSYTENAGTFITVEPERLKLAMLPRTVGTFRRTGLIVNKLRYRALNFTNDYLDGGSETVAYDPTDVTHVYLIRNGEYHKFDIIDSYFAGKTLKEAGSQQTLERKVIGQYREESIKSEVKMGHDIDTLVYVKKKGIN